MSQRMSMLEGSLVSAKEYAVGEPVVLRFDLTNNGEEDLFVLTWYTPLEGLFSDCLEVRRNGERVEYDGALVKRGKPTIEENYVLVPAGGTVSNEFTLNYAYDVSTPASYSVALDTEVRDFLPASAAVDAVAVRNRQPSRQPLAESRTGFVVTEGEGEPLVPDGQRLRNEERAERKANADPEPRAKQGRPGALAAAKDPTFNGGTAAQQAQTKQAHFDGFKLCEDALAGLANDANYKEWFGTHTAARFKKVKDNYTTVRDNMQTKTYKYDLTGAGCQSNWYAHTRKGITTIWMCNLFWSAPATGTDSKAGTVLHEHTHCDAGTDDIEYGQTDCRQLAIDNPDDAVRNADNYEYYGKG